MARHVPGRASSTQRVRTAILGALACALVIPAMAAGAQKTSAAGLPAANTLTYVDGVACATAQECWAVGYGGSSGATIAGFIESWNGNAWVRTPSPPVPSLSFLKGVACADARDCWAVGFYYAGTPFSNPEDADSIIERWDGSSWTMVSAPTGTALAGVTCATVSSCWAVGDTDPTSSGGLGQPLIEHWDGTSWSLASSPSLPDDDLQTVTCVTVTDCWAGGTTGNPSDPSDSAGLIEGWNGTVWTPYAELQSGPIIGVACASSTECWTVSLLETIETEDMGRWNGTSWTFTDVSNRTSLESLACVSPTECWAVGTAQNSLGIFQTVIEAWNGVSWNTINSPNPISNNSLYGVACVASTDCWAVGDNYQQGVHELWDGTSWSAKVQEYASSITYDRWRGVGDSRASETAGETASLSFAGTGVTWLTATSPRDGVASVAIDGVSRGNVDLYTPKGGGLSETYGGLAAGTHTIVITVTGTKNADSRGATIPVDGFQVASDVIVASSPEITYDTWAGATNAAASGTSYRLSATPRAHATFSFTGTGVDWITATGPAMGMARVSIDGSLTEIVDLYSATPTWQVVEAFSGLTLGPHSISIWVVGNTDPHSSGTSVVVDAFVIHG